VIVSTIVPRSGRSGPVARDASADRYGGSSHYRLPRNNERENRLRDARLEPLGNRIASERILVPDRVDVAETPRRIRSPSTAPRGAQVTGLVRSLPSDHVG
jgi:hypothetical protein